MVITIGQIGNGYWGPNVASSFKATERAEIGWICDINPDSLKIFTEHHPEARPTDRMEDIFGDPAVDAVAIVTPSNTHYEMAKAALMADKHVLVEKPITTVVSEAEELVELAENRNRVLMVGHVFQYNATILALKELIANGDLGDINYLSLERTNLGPVRTDVNALWDLVSHDAYIMMDLLDAVPRAVSALAQAYLNPSVEDVVFATFTFDCGVMAHVHASWLNPRKVRQITAVGSRKMAVWDDLDPDQPIRIYDKRVEQPGPDAVEGTYGEYKTMVVDGGMTTLDIEANRPLQSECEHFLDCIENAHSPRSDGRNGLDVVRVLTAAGESIRNQGALTPVA